MPYSQLKVRLRDIQKIGSAKQSRFSLTIATGLAALSLCATTAHANEIMTDRCSAHVAFPKHYTGRPNSVGTIILKRGENGWSSWTEPFVVETGDDGHVRWWCHSTTGNIFDPGTWRPHLNPGGIAACLGAAGATVVSEGSAAGTLAACTKVANFTSSAWRGWTPERSRCGNHSTRIRARLGPDRLLHTECLGD